MRPLTVITGILLGSCLSIAFSLAAVLLIFLVLGNDYPRLSQEYGSLLASFSIFTAMTAISAVSFYALVKHHQARWAAQFVMWSGLAGVVYFYWP
jgi:hypothetical protein